MRRKELSLDTFYNSSSFCSSFDYRVDEMIPNVAEVIAAQNFLTAGNLTLKLFSNNVTPAEGDTASSYTEVAGGGYVSKTLSNSSWTITAGDPTKGTYAAQDFSFTGPTNAPGTIYGYFLVDGSNVLRGSERFGAGVVPFNPVLGSLIRITPKLQVS